MIFRRLIAWFRFGGRQPLPPPPVAPEAAVDREPAFDLDEFGRLLSSGSLRTSRRSREP
jgi:hypothetical protein